MTESTEATEIVDAELVIWRVFGVSDVYDDRPTPDWSFSAQKGPSPDDNLRVYIGDVPDELATAIHEWNVHRDALMRGVSAESTKPDGLNDQLVAEFPRTVPKEFANPYPLWFTLRLSRPFRVSAVCGRRLRWLVGLDWESGLQEFEESANPFLDATSARMIAASHPMNLGRLRYGNRRAFLLAPGRAAFRNPVFRISIPDSGIRVGRAEGWSAAPTDAVAKVVDSLPSGVAAPNFAPMTTKAAEWYSYAASVDEDADLPRFVFAVAGLEVLTQKTKKASRAKLLQALGGFSQPLPLGDLLWPSSSEASVERNFLCNFATMASAFSPGTALEDTDACRDIVRTRNDLFHGKENLDVRDSGIRCKELLRRYLGLIA